MNPPGAFAGGEPALEELHGPPPPRSPSGLTSRGCVTRWVPCQVQIPPLLPGTAGTTLPPSSSVTAGLGPAVAAAAGLKTEPKVPGLVILKKRVFAFAGPRSFKCSVMYKQINRWKKYLINRKKKKKAFQKTLLHAV